MFLKVLCWYHHIWSSSHLQCLLTHFSMKPSISPARVWGICVPFVDILSLHFLLPFVAQSLSLYTLWSCQASLSADSLPFVFPRAVLSAQVYGLFKVYMFGPAYCMCPLTFCNSLSSPWNSHRELAIWWVVCVCGWGMWSTGGASGTVREIHRGSFPSGL